VDEETFMQQGSAGNEFILTITLLVLLLLAVLVIANLIGAIHVFG
jgi:hypothetical protein